MPTAVNGVLLAESVAELSSKSIAWAAWRGVDAYETTRGPPPPMVDYLRTQIDTTNESLARLRKRTAQLLGDGTAAGLHELFQLTNDWSYVMQEMSVLWRPGLYLTPKPFTDDWSASAKAMTLISSLLVFKRGLPAMHLRARGSPRSWRHPHRLLECSSQLTGHKDHGLFFQAAWKLRIAPTSDALLEELWTSTLRLGGVLVASNDRIAGVSIGHLGFITAWRTPTGERVFLLSDPEYATYKVLNFEQMRHFVSHQPHAVDFLTVD